MRKDLRGREALRRAPELVEVANSPDFDSIKVEDLRKLAELIRDFSDGALAGISIETATAFGGTSRHRFQCAKRALRALVGPEHPATSAVSAALSNLAANKRKGSRLRDDRTRDAILHADRWDPFRSIAALQTIPMNELRALDRFLKFCERHGRSTETSDFLAFVADQDSSMLLRTLRGRLEKLLTPAHPAVMAVERARSEKETERYRRIKPEPSKNNPARPLACSVPRDELPCHWLHLLDQLSAGKRMRGRTVATKTIDGMTLAARQLVRAARDAGLPDEISLDTIATYDRALEKRSLCATSRHILFTSLHTLAKYLGLKDSLLADIRDLANHYQRQTKGEVKRKEARLAGLPDLKTIFQRANALLDLAPETMDRRQRTTLYVDAAALPFLSLIPLRNRDTCLHWGREILYIGDDDRADWGLEDSENRVSYYLDLRTSKTDSALSGPLDPILTPFLDALILLGQDERLLPDLRKAAIQAQTPVFPKSNGKARNMDSLSARWRVHLGTGSIISRTRIHTLLAKMGVHGRRAAMALCAQMSGRTARWYEADMLAAQRMHESQDMIADLIEVDDETEELLARL